MSNLPKIWKTPEMPAILKGNEAHIWLVEINKQVRELDYYASILTSDEKKRSSRFVFEKDRNRDIINRAVLRLLLSKYIKIDPGRINYNYNKFNKPELSHPVNNELKFNLSHSGNLIIYAFSLRREIGIDIEKKRELNDADGIISRFCSEQEKSEYFSYPAEERGNIFISCWTRKEAYIKARGEGLAFPLNNFTMTLAPDKSPALMHVKDEKAEEKRWSFYNIIVPDDYNSTLAIEGNNIKLLYYKWIH
ncbi:MAG: 4'-phosphopantetheinyl transferase superfamily protein [Spirochaetes bacterium]|nr:4'-phosphopantetheinyl transferase superfamily protein [Spirochaetota bacterium]